MTYHYSPLRYPGGKNCIFSFMSQMYYENNLIGLGYAEPYAGGAGLALRLLFEGYAERIYINDLDPSIYAFWNAVLSRPEDFCAWISEVPINIKTWRKFKEIQNHRNEVNYFELAKSTFFLNRTNVSGIIKGGPIGGLNQIGKYKLDVRFNKLELIQRIKKIIKLKDRIYLSNEDGIKFISKLDRRQTPVLIYIDPPYYHKGRDLYMNYYVDKDHKRLAQHVQKLKQRWIVSYDNHPLILNNYHDRQKIKYNLSQSASNRVGEEVIIFSDALDHNDSIKKLVQAQKI